MANTLKSECSYSYSYSYFSVHSFDRRNEVAMFEKQMSKQLLSIIALLAIRSLAIASQVSLLFVK